MKDGEAPRAASQVLRFFLVEDSELIRQNLISTLEELLDMRVQGVAEDGAGAQTWLEADEETHPCELIVIDIFLKRGTGLELLRQAREKRPRARRVVFTNYATPDMRRRCKELGADQVFDKSSEIDGLIAYCEALRDKLARTSG